MKNSFADIFCFSLFCLFVVAIVAFCIYVACLGL